MAGGMLMPGGWTLSMAWMTMPGASRPRAGVAFVGMWVVMMIAMMTPPLAGMLANYRRGIRGRGQGGLAGRTGLAGAGYFAVWAVFGAVAWPLGPLAISTARSRACALFIDS